MELGHEKPTLTTKWVISQLNSAGISLNTKQTRELGDLNKRTDHRAETFRLNCFNIGLGNDIQLPLPSDPFLQPDQENMNFLDLSNYLLKHNILFGEVNHLQIPVSKLTVTCPFSALTIKQRDYISDVQDLDDLLLFIEGNYLLQEHCTISEKLIEFLSTQTEEGFPQTVPYDTFPDLVRRYWDYKLSTRSCKLYSLSSHAMIFTHSDIPQQSPAPGECTILLTPLMEPPSNMTSCSLDDRHFVFNNNLIVEKERIDFYKHLSFKEKLHLLKKKLKVRWTPIIATAIIYQNHNIIPLLFKYILALTNDLHNLDPFDSSQLIEIGLHPFQLVDNATIDLADINPDPYWLMNLIPPNKRRLINTNFKTSIFIRKLFETSQQSEYLSFWIDRGKQLKHHLRTKYSDALIQKIRDKQILSIKETLANPYTSQQTNISWSYENLEPLARIATASSAEYALQFI
jgi:hypothetical protein